MISHRSKRVLRILAGALRGHPRQLLLLCGWSVVQVLPTLVSGYAIARAVDDGFLTGRVGVGLAWLGLLAVAVGAGAWGTGHIYQHLSDIIEPFRDQRVRRRVRGTRRRAAVDRADGGAVSRLTHQVEIVRDCFASLVLIAREFLFTAAGALLGLAALEPGVLWLVVPPLVLGLGLFFRSLGRMVFRQRDYVLADERVSRSTGDAAEGLRDITAFGAEQHVGEQVAEHVDAHARASMALARMTAVRTSALALGGWVPVVLVLVAAPWLIRGGTGPGVIMGALTYLVQGLRPALESLIEGIGGGGLRLLVTLDRLAEVDEADGSGEVGELRGPAPSGYRIELRGVRFSFGEHADPVLDGFDLTVDEGEHLAVVGPSGIGKSTLANLIVGTLAPLRGSVRIGGSPVTQLDTTTRAQLRALIPQQAYVFDGTVAENLRYLNPAATDGELDVAVAAIGLGPLVERLGGHGARVDPGALSAGEAQMIALARTYLSPAPIVVLDEATCSLDPGAERRAETAFAERGGTLVVIAHRMSSALRADRVLVMDGHRVAVGTHSDLFARSPLYRSLIGHWEGSDRELPIPSPARSSESLRSEP
jgi:ATP-binding cassette subfamily C protein